MTLTYERLHEVLHYTPFDGLFRWKITGTGRPIKGTIAGCFVPKKYVLIGIDGINYKAHRLAWFYVYGYMPENDIDHIKRNKHDNRIRKLREVSNQCNSRNRGNFSNNTSGIKGVSFNKIEGKWNAYIYLNNKRHRLGDYKKFHNAVCARLAGEQCLNWEGCDSCSPAYLYAQRMLGVSL